jgi:hypothetical protein
MSPFPRKKVDSEPSIRPKINIQSQSPGKTIGRGFGRGGNTSRFINVITTQCTLYFHTEASVRGRSRLEGRLASIIVEPHRGGVGKCSLCVVGFILVSCSDDGREYSVIHHGNHLFRYRSGFHGLRAT